MKRDIPRLQTTSFDAVVIGAGIYGSTICRLLALAGYQTALIEKGDFCQATSANSLKILHGGLRYLQHLNLKRMRESIVCRRDLMQFSPHLAKPLSCLMPTQGHGARSSLLMGLALALNDFVSFDRNEGTCPDLHLPRGKILPRDQLLSFLPGLQTDDITGAANWFDGLAENTERMVLEHILDAARFGACPANYVRADTITHAKNIVTGITATDLTSNKTLTINARIIINAAGPWFAELLQRSALPSCPGVYWAKAINLVVDRQLHPDHAIGLESREGYQDKDALIKRGKRLYFFVPWRDKTMIGTTYKSFTGPADTVRVLPEDIDEIIDEVNAIYPAFHLCLNDVTFVHYGLVPMSEPGKAGEDVQIEKNSLIIDHESATGPAGLISVKGIKYTTASHAAREVLTLVQKKLSPSSKEVRPADPSLPQHPQHETDNRLENKYGRFAADILPFITSPGGNAKLDPEIDILSGEIHYFIENEMALKLSDIVLRRSDLGTGGIPSTHMLQSICTIMATKLNWDTREQKKQIKELIDLYHPLTQSTKTINNDNPA